MNNRLMVQRNQATAIFTKPLHSFTTHSTLVAPFAATLRTADTGSIAIPVKNVRTGTYSMRVQTDGAKNPLSINQAGESDLPQLTIL